MKNALLLLASTAGGSEEIALEKIIPDGEAKAVASPASEDSLKKAIRQERPRQEKPKILCPIVDKHR